MSVSAFNNGLLIQFLTVCTPDVNNTWSDNTFVSFPTSFSSEYIIVFGDTTPYGVNGNGVVTYDESLSQFRYRAFNTGMIKVGVIVIGS